MEKCPCGSNLNYNECCGAYHSGKTAPTAEAVMRARYSAYVKANVDYVMSTQKDNTDFDPVEAKRWAQNLIGKD